MSMVLVSIQPKELMDHVLRVAHTGYHDRTDYPPFSIDPLKGRREWTDYLRKVFEEVITKNYEISRYEEVTRG